MSKQTDIIIVGAGPAGLSAALYGARSGQSCLVFEKSAVGGLITQTTEIDNYPGSPENSTGLSLTERMRAQAELSGAELVNAEVTEVKKSPGGFCVTTDSSEKYECKALIIASGSTPKLLGISGETELRGRGVSYCATCDALFFKNKKVAVIGGGDSALKEAEYLASFASKVEILVRSDKVKAFDDTLKKVKAKDNINIRYNTSVKSINGKFFVESLTLENTLNGHSEKEPFDGVFIFVGFIPNTTIFKDLVAIDEDGWIITNDKMQTSLSGVYAAGDVRNTPLRQVITAAADGACAAYYTAEFIRSGENNE